ncbi:hypothetical protein [Pseudomonas aeruginosa]|uniref:hypothetical protein n=1 Tax=Pseudomonas aeruginosa TaxID=287 RepID=UPI00106CA0E8|nr:hypothetical protein [Pseudomonas aeruginosa]MBF8797779.1 hypothetical protein [Pseudomonas aeruginosa]HCF2592233.1 hypothetical protein [Pseudomonas aeruginosa]HCL3481827.1 hypothetical protein [Pseudomonas aeruginosa]HEO1756116.1 hypothetical protein [Pseudomonas aeruginosa]
MASKPFDLFFSSIVEEYSTTLPWWSEIIQTPYGGSILIWATVTFLGVMVTLKLKTANGLMLAFVIAVSGAMFIFINVAADNLKAKKDLLQLEERLAVLQEMVRTSGDALPDHESTEIPSQIYDLKRERDKLLALIEVAGILTNFSAMTLGGFGAGLLTSVAVSRRNREEELAVEAPVRKKLLGILLHLFCFSAISSMLTGVTIYILFSARWIAVHPLISYFMTSLAGLAATIILASIGYVLAFRSLHTGSLRLLGGMLIALLVAFLYTSSMKGALFYMGYPALLINFPLLLAFTQVRTWLSNKLHTLNPGSTPLTRTFSSKLTPS